jgi:hypothetical protein
LFFLPFGYYKNRKFNGYSGPAKIPLNPPLPKGDFNSPLRKRGAGGDFHASWESASGRGELGLEN